MSLPTIPVDGDVVPKLLLLRPREWHFWKTYFLLPRRSCPSDAEPGAVQDDSGNWTLPFGCFFFQTLRYAYVEVGTYPPASPEEPDACCGANVCSISQCGKLQIIVIYSSRALSREEKSPAKGYRMIQRLGSIQGHNRHQSSYGTLYQCLRV